MSKPEYTEGPWVWGHSGIDGLWVGPFDETPVAIVPHDGGWEGIPSRDNSRNNARLIAAAPDMLDALEDLQARYVTLFDLYARPTYHATADFRSDCNLALETSAAAINKAKGE